MKKRLFCLSLAALMLLALLAGCGSMSFPSTNSAAYETAPADDGGWVTEDYDTAYANAGYMSEAETPSALDMANVKLIKRANVNLETLDLDAARAEIERMTAELGGYLENSEFYAGSQYSGSTRRTASYVVRVPAENYEAFLAGVQGSEACHITSMSESEDDVGEQYFDLELRLQTQRTKQARLLEFLEQAETMSDIIELEYALSEVEYMIEYYTSELNRYDSLIGFSTINVYLEQVARVTETAEQPTDLWTRVSTSFRNGLNGLGEFGEDLLVFLAAAILPLLIIGLIVFLIVWLCTRPARKRRKAARAALAQQQAAMAQPVQQPQPPQQKNE